MIEAATKSQRDALIHALGQAYVEIFPTPTIGERLDILEPGSYLAITCSPSRGVEETLDLTEHLAGRGFRVVPHIAAKMVSGQAHLGEIMARLDDLPVDSVFVPGGDSPEPAGVYSTAFELLRDIAEYDHRFTEIGIAAHPEGHPDVRGDVLMRELQKKQPLASYLVTQMCFDAAALGRWMRDIRAQGITLPVWIGIPGVADRTALLRTSLRIGVGESLRFLRRKKDFAGQLLRHSKYTPDGLLSGMAPYLADPSFKVDGFHIYCFNQVESTEIWRRRALDALSRYSGQPAVP